jgi:hypothetical protein
MSFAPITATVSMTKPMANKRVVFMCLVPVGQAELPARAISPEVIEYGG